jgi:hypothetical protein
MEILAEAGRSLGEDHPIANVEGVGGLYRRMSVMTELSVKGTYGCRKVDDLTGLEPPEFVDSEVFNHARVRRLCESLRPGAADKGRRTHGEHGGGSQGDGGARSGILKGGEGKEWKRVAPQDDGKSKARDAEYRGFSE